MDTKEILETMFTARLERAGGDARGVRVEILTSLLELESRTANDLTKSEARKLKTLRRLYSYCIRRSIS